MPLMLSKLYDALLEAGASEAKARDAAEEAATYENRFVAIETRLERIETRLEQTPTKADFAALEVRLTRLVLVCGALGGLVGGIAAVVARLVKFI